MTKFTIGRDQSCDIAIAHDSVSRRHAEIIVKDGRVFLTDCRSSNGTFLLRGGKPQSIRQEFVAPEDQVQFGSVALRVGDILETLQRKHPELQSASVPPPKEVQPKSWADPAQGKTLVRCGCGTVKVKGERCPLCGS